MEDTVQGGRGERICGNNLPAVCCTAPRSCEGSARGRRQGLFLCHKSICTPSGSRWQGTRSCTSGSSSIFSSLSRSCLGRPRAAAFVGISCPWPTFECMLCERRHSKCHNSKWGLFSSPSRCILGKPKIGWHSLVVPWPPEEPLAQHYFPCNCPTPCPAAHQPPQSRRQSRSR